MSKCKSCGAEIIWAETETGKSMPLDAEPSQDGNVWMDGDVAMVGRSAPAAMNPPRYMPHWATCPQAKSWKRSKQPADGR